MAGFAGPRANDSSLVFGYDTGYGLDTNNVSSRFYPGETTTNEFANSTILSYSSGYGGIGTLQSGVQDAFGTTDNPVYRKTGKIRFGPTNGTDIGTLYYGNTYTFSIYMRHVPGETQTNSAEFDIVDRADTRNFSGNLGDSMTYDWKRFIVTANHNNNSNYHFIDIGVYQGTNVFEWCCPQINIGSHVTPYTGDSRSSTQSLLDLSGNTTIDVANVSFDSSGQPTFDGTDDVIQLSTGLVDSLNTAELTVEAIVYHTSWGVTNSSRPYVANWNTWDNTTPNQRGFILRTFGTEQFPRFWWCWGANYSNVSAQGATFNLNQFHHVVGVYKKDSYAKIYVDGVEAGSTTSNVGNHLVYDDTTGTRIGYGTINTGRFVGDLPVIKLYDRALTGNEVLKNYNQLKNRFSLL